MSEATYFPALLALLSAFLFALSMQVQSLGISQADPRSATLVHIATTTLIYWLLSPFFLEKAFWLSPAVFLFAAVGLFRPVVSANLAVAGVKMLGPTLTSGLASVVPIFSAVFAVIILGEQLTWPIAWGTLAVVAGVAVAAIRPAKLPRNWPLWALTLPLGAAFFRAISHPIVMVGFRELANPFFAILVGYSVSLIVALIAFRVQGRKFSGMTPNYGWFVVAGAVNAMSIYSLNTALKLGKLLTVAPVLACSPVFTILLSVLFFKRETITWQTTLTITLVVSGILLVVMQSV